MTDFPRWNDVHVDVVAGAGSEQGISEARKRNHAYIDGHRLAERRNTLGLSQTDVAEKMSVYPDGREYRGPRRGRNRPEHDDEGIRNASARPCPGAARRPR
ncbi:helix-turn-helix transcriptional regulator [Actinoallomurus sp. NPDC050550]|uniref:helix-turn-helix domain-containing protein n=1 Tax=Actinoallomurus sp. NPDC050550 TaxID=3154937 RepID=UPI0033E06D52